MNFIFCLLFFQASIKRLDESSECTENTEHETVTYITTAQPHIKGFAEGKNFISSIKPNNEKGKKY